MKLGFALCGSFCTFAKVIPLMEILAQTHDVIPIFSQTAYSMDTRFGPAQEHIDKVEAFCRGRALHTIKEVEPFGPKKTLDALVIAPCTGNSLAKLAHGIADTPVTMAAKSHLRNGRPVILAVSTNDGLAAAMENIGRLMTRKHFYFVPFGQDDPFEKPTSLVADFSKIPQTLELALKEQQIQPILL